MLSGNLQADGVGDFVQGLEGCGDELGALDTLAVTYKVWTTTVALVMPMPESMISVIASGLTVPLNFAAVRTEEGWG